MKIPRDIGGDGLVILLRKYGYQITRQTSSHIRLTSTIKGEHHLTIPKHKPIRIGTINNILNDLADYLKKDKQKVTEELFG
jgi:predicted RNA binding protein YcfA (HicA-like mRNA interferase family)